MCVRKVVREMMGDTLSIANALNSDIFPLPMFFIRDGFKILVNAKTLKISLCGEPKSLGHETKDKVVINLIGDASNLFTSRTEEVIIFQDGIAGICIQHNEYGEVMAIAEVVNKLANMLRNRLEAVC